MKTKSPEGLFKMELQGLRFLLEAFHLGGEAMRWKNIVFMTVVLVFILSGPAEFSAVGRHQEREGTSSPSLKQNIQMANKKKLLSSSITVLTQSPFRIWRTTNSFHLGDEGK